ncbi:hypothetical protein NBRC13296_12610 [Paenibacillus chitinolyticus]|uniref:hypothetical protein n=1 Tax=Paenibacillus chitinolyticus TaxID=79263 RepID=UPI003558F9EF
MYNENFYKVVVKYTGESTTNGLTKDNLYGVETDEDLVDEEVYTKFKAITVWNDSGRLHEIEEGDYELVEEAKWFSTVPEKRYIEIN